MHIHHHAHPFHVMFQKISKYVEFLSPCEVDSTNKNYVLTWTTSHTRLTKYNALWMICGFFWMIHKSRKNHVEWTMCHVQYVMFMIIADVEMVFLNHIVWLRSAIHTVNVHLCMFVQDMYDYRHVNWMIVLTLYLSLGRKCVILSEVYQW